MSTRTWCAVAAAIALLVGVAAVTAAPRPAVAATNPCGPPVVSVIACENSQPGDPESDWRVTSPDASIQGFGTAMSVNVGGTIGFKVSTPAASWHVDILRIGWYQGNGARKIATGLKPSVALPQSQPACLSDASTGLVDCGNWATSLSWSVPSSAVSGLYEAHLVRDDTGGSNEIMFVVRNDASTSDVLVQTSDTTWQAYNTYGGNSLYTGSPAGRAYKVSYNRPFNTGAEDYVWYAEYPMVRFLEANGFDVSYTSGADVDANAAVLKNHKVFVSSGHDEYWSNNQRANVKAARDAGVNLAFFSGNEMFWKTRWEPSIDGTSTPYRTLVTYKETHQDAPLDPQDPPTWTGTWRDPRFSPPADGGRPESSLTGQFFIVNAGTSSLQVPAAYGAMRLWRNTAAATQSAGSTLTLAPSTLGYEWDEDVDNGFRPAGLVDLSATTVSGVQAFSDYGNTTTTATKTHHLTLYRAPSGALVFGAGTVQWSWGLDSDNPNGNAANVTMQQATLNLFADMGVQPFAPIAGLTAATKSTDTTPPTVTLGAPAAGATVGDGTVVTVSGTASDSGGQVAGVEVSTDGGSTWHPATGTTSWSYRWIAHGTPSTNVLARATDDSGNISAATAATTVNVSCPCTLWGPNVTPGTVDSGDAGAVELGFKMTSDVAGTITGVRFYKASTNTGTHIGNVWSTTGQNLASATFTNETGSGWQQVNFSTPVTVTAGTTYIVSYYAPNGHYSASDWYFSPPPSPPPEGGGWADAGPLHALRNTGSTTDGIYAYGSTSSFPQYSYHAENYGVDVVFTPSGTQPPPSPTPPGAPTGVTATAGNASASVSWTAPSNGGSAITSYTVRPSANGVAQAPIMVTGNPPATSTTVTNLTNGTSYTFTVTATNAVGTGPASAASNAVTPTAPPAATVPGAPTNVVASAAKLAADVSWTAPAEGGSAVTSYTVAPWVNGVAQAATTVSGTTLSVRVQNLTAGTSYTFTVTATNAVGTGPASSPSNAVTPQPRHK